jgi:hypothetical protein
MKNRWMTLVAMVVAFQVAAPRVMADEPTPESVVADVLLVRPAGVVVVAAGAAAMLVSLPFAAMARNVQGTADTLVGKPARLLFCRRLGDFRAMKENSVEHRPPRREGQAARTGW